MPTLSPWQQENSPRQRRNISRQERMETEQQQLILRWEKHKRLLHETHAMYFWKSVKAEWSDIEKRGFQPSGLSGPLPSPIRGISGRLSSLPEEKREYASSGADRSEESLVVTRLVEGGEDEISYHQSRSRTQSGQQQLYSSQDDGLNSRNAAVVDWEADIKGKIETATTDLRLTSSSSSPASARLDLVPPSLRTAQLQQTDDKEKGGRSGREEGFLLQDSFDTADTLLDELNNITAGTTNRSASRQPGVAAESSIVTGGRRNSSSSTGGGSGSSRLEQARKERREATNTTTTTPSSFGDTSSLGSGASSPPAGTVVDTVQLQERVQMLEALLLQQHQQQSVKQ